MTTTTGRNAMMHIRLRDVMTPGLMVLDLEATVAEAIRLMAENRKSCVPVVKNGRPVGIFTERGIVRLAARRGAEYARCAISEAMSAPVITAEKDMFVHEAIHILTVNDIRHLVIIDRAGQAVGVVTLSDIIDALGDDLFTEPMPASRIMSRVVHTVREDAAVNDILAEMAERSISCVVHVRDDVPQGILTERDVAGLAASGKDLAALTLREVMHAPVVTTTGSAPIKDVLRLMREKGIRRVAVVDPQGILIGLVTQSDIVKGFAQRCLRILEQIIEEKQARLRTATEDLGRQTAYLDGILRSAVDMGIVATDTELRVIYFNPAAEKIVGCPADRAIGKRLVDLHVLEGVDAARVDLILAKLLHKGRHVFTFDREIDDETRSIQSSISGIWDKEGGLVGYVCMQKDVTERKKAEENIRYLAYHDILTGLPNRVSLSERLGLEMARARRDGTGLAVMLLDLDNFKDINDTMGHYAGDLLLQGLAGRLMKAVRECDTVSRVGGDEFVLVFSGIKGEADAGRVAAKIFEALDRPFEIKGQAVRAVVSLGVALCPENGTTPKILFEAADRAMYAAKRLGRENHGSNMAMAGPVGDGQPDEEVMTVPEATVPI